MKRQTQLAGVRRWYGDDLLELQSEPLKALDGIFGKYGPCIISGCDVMLNGNKYDVSSGLVALKGAGPDGATERMVVPFAGATSVALPVYLSLACETTTGQYDDGEVKPVSYGYYAQVTSVVPEGEHIAITASGGTRFVDVIQDAAHRFVTDSERTVWNDKETPAGAQAKANAAILEAKGYTDTREETTRTDFDGALLQVITGAVDYIDTAKAEILGNAPALLNSLEKLALSINNEPNFYEWIKMQLQGKQSHIQNVTINNFDTFDPSSLNLAVGESCFFNSYNATGKPSMGDGDNDSLSRVDAWSGFITRVYSTYYRVTALSDDRFIQTPCMATRMYTYTEVKAWQIGTESANKRYPGYAKFPSGLMIQWGHDAPLVDSSVPYTLTFPLTFASIFAFVATRKSTSNGVYSITFETISTSNAILNGANTGANGTIFQSVGQFHWIAIGKWA